MRRSNGGIITIEETTGIDFEFHFEGGAVVIDKCEGITPEQGMSMFPDWMLDAMQGRLPDA